MDVRTLLLVQTIIHSCYTAVVIVIWIQYRRRFEGLGFWLAASSMQTGAFLLLVLRDIAPLWLSVLVSNAMILSGVILLYIGLERFFDERSKQYHNALFFVLFIALHGYFTFNQPNLAVRAINISVGLLFISLQIVWLMLKRIAPEIRRMTRVTGIIFAALALASLIRIVYHLVDPTTNNLIFQTSAFDAFVLLFYTVLYLAITFSLLWVITARLSFQNEHHQGALQKSEARYRDLVDLSPDAIYIYQDGKFVFVNSAGVALIGAKSPEDLLGKVVLDFVHPDFLDRSRERIAMVATQGVTAPLAYTKLKHLDGTYIDVDLTTSRFEYEGKPALYTIVRDITARKRAEDVIQLRLKLNEFAADYSLKELMTYALDEIGEITQSPIGFYHFVESDQETLSLQAWSTRTMEEFCHAEGEGMHYGLDQAGVWVDCVRERKPVIHNDYEALPHRKGLPPGHAPVKRELVVPTMRHGKIVSILGVGNKSANYDEQDIELVSYVADVIWDIIARKRAETKLQDYQQQLEKQNLELLEFSLAIEQSGNSVMITDKNGLIQYVNPRFEETTGYTLDELEGNSPQILESVEQDADLFRDLWQGLTEGRIWHGEFQLHHRNGAQFWESATIAPVLDTNGQVMSFIAIMEDISQRKEMEEKLTQMATTDSLTGVLNRRQLTSMTEQELKRAHRYGHITSIVMLDLDYLKNINDRFGHGAGDLAIRRTAQVLKDNLRAIDFLGRYGGDEFVVILPETDCDHAMSLAERLRAAVAAQDLLYGTEKFTISITLGVTCVEIEEDKSIPDFSQVTSLADEALYAAKAAGRNCVRVK